MKFKFENLIIWQKAMDFGEEIHKLSSKFPKKEVYNLTSQINRAVDSIALNISEGSIGQSNPEFKRFMSYSTRSLAEVATCLHKAIRRKYITKNEFDINYNVAFNLMNMMIGFKNSLKQEEGERLKRLIGSGRREALSCEMEERSEEQKDKIGRKQLVNTSDFGLQTLDFGLQTSNFKLFKKN